ncbi:DsbA family protein [Streptomyces ipomoeae]|uniref:DsbA family protein n=1 Tax=Streptomyces ipomoeae TaxID=103232 RepID=UPI0011465273|nr:DsbA family protein [Streptomyces ipomoeae]MDX2933990.1 DsbA family protein [Streptomyces ipomoeae]TQE28761.1 DsbA family protein [Streptomyces ipomoeae]
MRLVYVFDAYCGWSHGFSGTLREIAARHPEVQVEVVSGGLFTGGRRVPMAAFGYIQDANDKISELTGARFGDAYQRLVAEGSFVMDSEAAARGMAALRRAAPDRAAELAAAFQDAFYIDGQSLSDPATCRTAAEAAGLDAEAVVAAFEAPEARTEAEGDFRRAAELGVTGFPTLLAVDGERVTVLARGHATADDVDRRLAALGGATRTP